MAETIEWNGMTVELLEVKLSDTGVNLDTDTSDIYVEDLELGDIYRDDAVLAGEEEQAALENIKAHWNEFCGRVCDQEIIRIFCNMMDAAMMRQEDQWFEEARKQEEVSA